MDRKTYPSPHAAPRPYRRSWWSRNWFQLFVSALCLYVVLNKDVSIAFDLNSVGEIAAASSLSLDGRPQSEQRDQALARPAGLKPGGPSGERSEGEPVDEKGNEFRNLTFILNPTYARRKKIAPAIVEQKLKNCRAYVDRFAPVARTEMQKYGIPASITLAQGLLESDAGDSRLARESNNHFGIKCRAKCRGCTCRNYSDDDIYDMFRVFESAWKSFREHSILLNSSRYRHLLRLDRHDYQGWAHGLKKAGYATDKRYAHKLIRIIDALELTRYDH